MDCFPRNFRLRGPSAGYSPPRSHALRCQLTSAEEHTGGRGGYCSDGLLSTKSPVKRDYQLELLKLARLMQCHYSEPCQFGIS